MGKYDFITKDQLAYDYDIMPKKDIAEKYNVSVFTISNLLRVHKLNKVPTYDEVYDMLINKEMTTMEISKIYNLTRSQITKYVTKYNINRDDVYKKYKINDIQHDLIIGSILGDGCVTKKKQDTKSTLSISHAENQKKYLEFKFQIMRNLCNMTDVLIKNTDYKGTYNKQKLYWFYTKMIPQLNYYRELHVSEVLSSLNVNSFLIWLMDDGRLNDKYYTIGLTRFNMKEMQLTIKKLNDLFNLEAKINWYDKDHTKYMGLRFDAENSHKISSLIKESDFYPAISQCLSYKIINT